ncbi:hypothetical protein KFK14_17745 [Sphingobium phenoxybenzoativorans]|uniref:Uncharacterized protein n=1 Tax=Sphingobium phenoxybenzoativorans TaxID=1592790 RepID=A0A975Q0G9_9SPHN|nr:hypothetical protein [Sphingobium phenoxybenzoativorans]QUT04855.1 hypothetical protein KFK14_17745 [Sphingobium phenoxybenzoativorans]
MTREEELDAAVRRVLGVDKTPAGMGQERFRNFLAFFLISAFVATLPLLVFKTIPEANKDIIVYIIGQISGMALTALGFYFVNKFGAEAADAKRADNTAKAFEAITASANATPTAPVQAEIANDTNNPIPTENVK